MQSMPTIALSPRRSTSSVVLPSFQNLCNASSECRSTDASQEACQSNSNNKSNISRTFLPPSQFGHEESANSNTASVRHGSMTRAEQIPATEQRSSMSQRKVHLAPASQEIDKHEETASKRPRVAEQKIHRFQSNQPADQPTGISENRSQFNPDRSNVRRDRTTVQRTNRISLICSPTSREMSPVGAQNAASSVNPARNTEFNVPNIERSGSNMQSPTTQRMYQKLTSDETFPGTQEQINMKEEPWNLPQAASDQGRLPALRAPDMEAVVEHAHYDKAQELQRSSSFLDRSRARILSQLTPVYESDSLIPQGHTAIGQRPPHAQRMPDGPLLISEYVAFREERPKELTTSRESIKSTMHASYENGTIQPTNATLGNQSQLLPSVDDLHKPSGMSKQDSWHMTSAHGAGSFCFPIKRTYDGCADSQQRAKYFTRHTGDNTNHSMSNRHPNQGHQPSTGHVRINQASNSSTKDSSALGKACAIAPGTDAVRTDHYSYNSNYPADNSFDRMEPDRVHDIGHSNYGSSDQASSAHSQLAVPAPHRLHEQNAQRRASYVNQPRYPHSTQTYTASACPPSYSDQGDTHVHASYSQAPPAFPGATQNQAEELLDDTVRGSQEVCAGSEMATVHNRMTLGEGNSAVVLEHLSRLQRVEYDTIRKRLDLVRSHEISKLEVSANLRNNAKMNLRGRARLEAWFSSCGPKALRAVHYVVDVFRMNTEITAPYSQQRTNAMLRMNNESLRICDSLMKRVQTKDGRFKWELMFLLMDTLRRMEDSSLARTQATNKSYSRLEAEAKHSSLTSW